MIAVAINYESVRQNLHVFGKKQRSIYKLVYISQQNNSSLVK